MQNIKKLGKCIEFNKPTGLVVPNNDAVLVVLKQLEIKRLLYADNAGGNKNLINREGVIHFDCNGQASVLHWETDHQGNLIQRGGLVNHIVYFGKTEGWLPIRVELVETNDPDIKQLERGSRSLTAIANVLGLVPGIGGILSSVFSLFSKLFTSKSKSKKPSSVELLYQGLLNLDNEANRIGEGSYSLIRFEDGKPANQEISVKFSAIPFPVAAPIAGGLDGDGKPPKESTVVVAIKDVTLNLDEDLDDYQFALDISVGRGKNTKTLELDLPISAKELGRGSRDTGWIDWVASLDHYPIYEGPWEDGLPVSIGIDVSDSKKWLMAEALIGGLADVAKARIDYRVEDITVAATKKAKIDQLAKATESIRKVALEYFENKVGASRDYLIVKDGNVPTALKNQFPYLWFIGNQPANSWYNLAVTLKFARRTKIVQGKHRGQMGPAEPCGEVTIELVAMVKS